jgi:hypothetical protein
MDTVIFTGRMPLEELQHDKPVYYERLLAEGTIEQHLDEAPKPGFVRFVKVGGFVALVVGFTLVALIVYSMLFSYR